jgi:hypothetical protein
VGPATPSSAGTFLVLLSISFLASAEKRVALVIGNGAYKAQNLLTNPPSDAHLISQALAQAPSCARPWGASRTKPTGEVALVYFAGRGIEEDRDPRLRGD